MSKFLIIQTAFTGDVILATALAEKLHTFFPDAVIDLLVRKGNEGLLDQHPFIGKVLVWDKTKNKQVNLLKMALQVRKERYTHVVNVHRFATSGFITFLSGASFKAGFDKNPFSFCYTRKVTHMIDAPYTENAVHETGRNQALIAGLTDSEPALPALYPAASDFAQIKRYQEKPYVCVAPSSVWYTKQFPAERWVGMIDLLPAQYNVYLLGAPGDKTLGEEIARRTEHKNVVNLCGQFNFLRSAALMKGAVMNYANDSAPLHIASAIDAAVTAVFCSTVPAFGFGPLRPNGKVVEVQERLYCRPCGLHGHKACPEGHFRCASEISNDQLLWWTSKTT